MTVIISVDAAAVYTNPNFYDSFYYELCLCYLYYQ